MSKIYRKYNQNFFSVNANKYASNKKGVLSFLPEFFGVELGWLYGLGLVIPFLFVGLYFIRNKFVPTIAFSEGLVSVALLLFIVILFSAIALLLAYLIIRPPHEFSEKYLARRLIGLRYRCAFRGWMMVLVFGFLLLMIGGFPGGVHKSLDWVYVLFPWCGLVFVFYGAFVFGFLERSEYYPFVVVVNIILLFASAYLISIGHAGVFYVAVVLLVLFYIAFVVRLGPVRGVFLWMSIILLMFVLIPLVGVSRERNDFEEFIRDWNYWSPDGAVVHVVGYARDDASILVKGDGVKYFDDVSSESDAGVVRCKISDDQIVVHGVDIIWHGLGSRSLINLRKGGGRIQLDSSLMQVVSSDKYLCVDVPTKVYFATGKAEDESSGIDVGSGNVSSWFKSDVDKLGDDLKNVAGRYKNGYFPHDYCLKKVAIKGNTDLMPAENFELGLHRANYVGSQINSALDEFYKAQLTECKKKKIGCEFCKAPEREVSSEGARNATIKQGCSQNIKGLTEKLLGQCGAPNRFVSVRLIFAKSDQWSEERPAPEENMPVVQGCWALEPGISCKVERSASASAPLTLKVGAADHPLVKALPLSTTVSLMVSAPAASSIPRK